MADEEELELPTLTGDTSDKKCRVSNRGGEWINHSSAPIKGIECWIDEEIVKRVRNFQMCVERKLGGSNEFGGFVKWHWDDGHVVVDDFMIPEQRVGGATVDFRSPATPGYTGVFHKHPTGCKNFSGVDDTYINANHDLSILFEGGNFITGIVNIPLPDKKNRLQIRLNIRVVYTARGEVDVSMVSAASSFREGFREVVRRPPASMGRMAPGGVGVHGFPQRHEDDDDELHLPEFLS